MKNFLNSIRDAFLRQHPLKRTVSVIAVVAMAVSLMTPAIAAAADTTEIQKEKIESFSGTLVRGASLQDGKYVWTPSSDADEHRFVFRVDYSMSGVKELEPGAIRITVPKSILRDRNGNAADYVDMSIPSEDEAKAADPKDDIPYTWKYSDDGNSIIVTNAKKRDAGEEGNFEIAYVTTEQTFEYADMGASEPFHADISVTNDGQTVTSKSAETPVYINTTAEISSTSKGTPEKLYRSWQSSWGTQPEEAKGKNYLVWQVVSKMRNDPTQPYSFKIVDTPKSSQLHLIGYSMGNQDGPFTDVNHVEGQRSDNDRYDYVLTWYDPKEFDGQDYYQLKNSVVATVTPADGIDAPTSASGSRTWEWDRPKFVHPTGHFYGQKYGDNNWHDKFGKYHDYSSYSLDQLQNGNISSIDTFRYYINTYGYPAPWTVDGDPDNPENYGRKKVTYQLTDDELYLNDRITSKKAAGEKLEYDIPKDARKLTSKDYQFLYADWSMKSDIRTFNDEDKKFVTDPNAKYSSDDVVHFWTKTDDGEYREVASYSMGTDTASIADSSVVSALDRNRITFTETANVTGIRFTTSNAYWYTIIEAYPMARLKNSDYVMKTIKDKKMIRLHNFAQSDVSDSNGKNIFSLRTYAFDRAASPQRNSEIEKHVTSTGSNKTKRKYTIRWAVTPKETLTTDEGTDYLVQKSGTFYDLLPKGTHLVKKSIDVETEKGMLSHSSFSYKVTEDYKGSGRDLVTVKVPSEAKYYRLYLSADMSWEAIKDYGTTVVNPVAYETGNDDIYNGYADNGGDSQLSKEDKAYLTGLDSKSSSKKRFIYAKATSDIDTVTAAVSGLRKQVRDEHDASYSYDTYTTPEGNYSYKIRFANTAVNRATDLIFFDSLENYDQLKSDWHGTLKRIDVSQLKEKGIEPVIYVSQAENLSIEEHHDVSDAAVWQKATDSTDWSKVKAFAIDCRKKTDGTDFVLNAGESLSAIAYMQAPASVAEVNDRYAKAYNNIYVQDTLINGETRSPMFIHQDYTELRYRVTADIAIHKQSADNAGISIEGAKYRLSGTSDYGTKVSEEVTTGAQGDAVFEGIEKGTYRLKETHSPDDWLLDKAEYTVKVDGTGKVTFNGKDEKIVLKDSPRIHSDISFMKLSTQKGNSNPVKGAKFRLEGKSHYGTDVMEYATSDDSGRVMFSNIEWGDYKLKEVVTPDGYIPSGKEYDASVSDAGIGGISDVEMLTSGSPVIKNEPYHTVEVSKQSSYDGSLLEGAEFKLTGTSDYGTPYDLKATSGSNGLASFKGLEAGTYVLQETKAPKGHIIDSTKRAVKVNADGTYTIDGLELNDSGKYRQDNEKALDGKIIVKKKWKDNKTNGQRSTPVIHITTDVNKIPSYAIWRDNYRNAKYPDDLMSAFYYVNPNYKSNTTEVRYADIPESEVPEDAVRMDSHYDDPDAKRKIYSWMKDGIMYYWTNAQTTKLVDGSHKLFTDMKKTTSIDLSRIDTSEVTDMSNMFNNCFELTSLDVSHFDTSKVTSMNSMFAGCSLTSLDVSGFDTSKVTDMSCMFSSCNLTSLNLSNWDTSNVTNMSAMFQCCSRLTSLDLPSFDTSKVTNMCGMFNDCENLASIDLSNFDTSNVTDMSSMFNHCKSLASIDLSSFDTSNVTSMSHMFYRCSGLKSLDVSGFDTSKVTSMYGMFYDCSGLASFDLSNFDTSEVTTMHNMFAGCSGLTSLDLSSFDTSNVTGMGYMFSGCSGLASIYVSDRWNTGKVTFSYGMFEDCSKLPNYSSSSNDMTHANYGPDGYLKYKAHVSSAKPGIASGLMSAASSLAKRLMSYIITPVHAAESAEYISTDSKNCTITKDGDEWTYEFSVADDSAKYYAYEDDVDGYTSSNDASSYGVTTKDEPLTITNTAKDYNEPKPASLSLSKTADGRQLVETDRPVEKYSHTSNIDDTGKTNGRTYSNNLSTNDVVTIPGASKLHVKLYCSTESVSWDWACVWAGSHPDYTAYGNYSSSKLGTTSGKIGGGAKTSMPATPIEGDIDGDTVTFGFKSDGSGTYYGYYAVVTDASFEYVQKTQPNGTQKWYQLSDTDTADIPSSYSDKAYMFDVTLSNSDSSKLSGTKIFGNIAFTDGKAEVGVKAGETKTFSGLPGGTTYTITEKKYDDFYTESKNATGTLKAGDSVRAKFINHYQKPKLDTADKGYGSFTLGKKVTGFYQNAHDYKFDVSFRKLEPEMEYSLSDGTKFTSDADGYGYVQAKLGDGKSVSFTDLPVGAQYRITEEGGDWSSAYKITNASSDGDIEQTADSAEKNEPLSTAWETVNDGEKITVDFTNTVKKYQSITLKKKVVGALREEKFKFKVDFTNLYETVKSDVAGEVAPEDDGTASIDIYLGAGDEVKFDNVPVTANYTVTEMANSGIASYAITDGDKVKSSANNLMVMQDLSTNINSVNEDEDVIVTFTNKEDRGILPTGMHRGHALAILAAIDIIAIGAAAAFMLRRRKKKEN